MIIVGQSFPKGITLKKITKGEVQDFSLDTLFDGKYILFALPGAFTPTCSNEHLPDYISMAQTLKSKGIKEIFCLAVNDHFVMKAWADAHHVGDEITFLADGSAILTKALGMELDLTSVGLGIRSKRYSLVLDNGNVTTINVEENPGTCTVSRASHLLTLI